MSGFREIVATGAINLVTAQSTSKSRQNGIFKEGMARTEQKATFREDDLSGLGNT
jgi:hypothetical protein